MPGFELVCEVEPPTRPDLKKVRHQIGVMSPIADAFLIPDNHIGRATVSSVAVANEVQAMGSRGIACLNSRDRNLLGFKRDLLTAAAYGVEQFLFVHGDDPAEGARTSQLTVRTMIEQARRDGVPGLQPVPGRRHHPAAAGPELEGGGGLPLRPGQLRPRRAAALARERRPGHPGVRRGDGARVPRRWPTTWPPCRS